jgi:predicted O-methyltransferase YrrM
MESQKIIESIADLKQTLLSIHSTKYNLNDYLWIKSIEESAEYVKPFLSNAMLFADKTELWNHAFSKRLDNGLCLEFGVFQGASINYFAQRSPTVNFYGFDSFEGLAEDWSGHHAVKGRFSLDGKLPPVLPNVSLVKGWFQDTVPDFLHEHNENISFIHIDCDTYESSKLVLSLLEQKIKSGVVIVFDEYLGYPGWKDGEFKALSEIREKIGFDYEYLAFATNQVSIKIK